MDDIPPAADPQSPGDSYDQLPYPDDYFSYSHPDALAAIATVRGMNPATATSCSVLELGCARGGNLVPLADQFPQSRFVGIDASQRQIEAACERVQRRGLRNLAFRCQDLMHFEEGEKFDYIICHGVFSWVPRPVQDKILDICARNLAPQGVAYISYNTYPGWRMREVLRDLMLHHARDISEPKAKVAKAREAVKLLAATLARLKTNHGEYLKGEIELVEKSTDNYLFHDHLEAVNAPCYFHEFVARSVTHGLQYVDESNPVGIVAPEIDAEMKETLRAFPDPIEREQFLDHVRNTTFRRSLLCRADVALEPLPRLKLFQQLHYSSDLKPEFIAHGTIDLSPGLARRFKSKRGPGMTTSQPLNKAAMLLLSEAAPGYLSFDDLLDRSLQRLREIERVSDRSVYAGKLAAILLDAHRHDAVRFRVRPHDFAATLPERPQVRRLARDRVAAGVKQVINFRHESIKLDDVQRRLVPLLDGSRDSARLSADLLQIVLKENLAINEDGSPVPREALPGAVASVVTATLQLLLDSAALIP